MRRAGLKRKQEMRRKDASRVGKHQVYILLTISAYNQCCIVLVVAVLGVKGESREF